MVNKNYMCIRAAKSTAEDSATVESKLYLIVPNVAFRLTGSRCCTSQTADSIENSF